MMRHGDTVWRVCLTALRHAADAEDAFQNSFLKYALADDVRFNDDEHRYLALYEGYTAPEIASLMEVPVNTVYSWIARGKKTLKEALL